MIPQQIHYCWFGNNPLTKDAINCIESWRKFFPDYEIIEWNEKNFNINECKYIKEAYEQKKWAFVSDYARIWIIYNCGGIYFDTDVKVLKSMEDIIEAGAFMGREQVRDGALINPGLGFGAEKNNFYLGLILKSYENDSFVLQDGSYNLYTIGQRVENILESNGFNAENRENQYMDGLTIYADEYFSPMGYDGIITITSNTRSIHLYKASWLSRSDRLKWRLTMKIDSSKGLKKFVLKVNRRLVICCFYIIDKLFYDNRN